ncbi:probable lysophospholipase BODYGUARD 4 [Herrania umbratica]|uniref:Probable lysophospholipase BODYGUARD 4 n=1 Tax=Herrania umbratica TaxID=108875 RepID=A0A6J1A4P2_9ROSI|nr:probable lysophospholipase BODYGUARD 4 [Herrania umbratica]
MHFDLKQHQTTNFSKILKLFDSILHSQDVALTFISYLRFVRNHSYFLSFNFSICSSCPILQLHKGFSLVHLSYHFPSFKFFFPSMSIANSLGKGTRKCGTILLDAITFFVFLFLDLLDASLCVVYKFLDEFFQGKASPCYCVNKGEQNGDCGDGERGLSETLYGRKNVFREMGFLGFARKWEYRKKRDGFVGGGRLVNRWSDCGCESCVSWMKNGCQKLHVVVKELPQGIRKDSEGNPSEKVIFIHGILSSSSFWTKTVFPKLSESTNSKYSLFAVDLLGFGKSPKPRDCLYTMKDHVEWIEKSVISPFQFDSFHVVAHSMGCIIALALAAKHSKSVKSISLVAPPYFPSKDGVEFTVMNCVTSKKLWPPQAFLSSIMAWYEHLGRCVCLLMCRNHRTWERLIKRFTGLRNLDFMLLDLTKHTHHSGWHTMHNVLFRGVKLMDKNLETLMQSRTKVHVILGNRDKSVPPECGNDIKKKFPDVEVNNIANAGHRSVIFTREKDFAQNLVRIWENAASDQHNHPV